MILSSQNFIIWVSELARAALLLIFVLLLGGCSLQLTCQNEIRGRSVSPDGRMTAIVFSRNCGATVGENYQVSILSSTESPRGSGNVLIADQMPPYSDKLKPIWRGNRSVFVPIPKGSRMFYKSDNVQDVKVTFV